MASAIINENEIVKFQSPMDMMVLLDKRECSELEIRTALFNSLNRIRYLEEITNQLVISIKYMHETGSRHDNP